MVALRAEFAQGEEQIAQLMDQEAQREQKLARDVEEMTSLRGSKQVRKGLGA
jgi:hypothetical protein